MKLILMTLLGLPACIQAHARWKCPPARSPGTGIKSGPCGSDTNDFSIDPLEISPGPMKVEIEESIFHTGAPFRIALSSDESDTENVCVLLDHIPHNDNPPSFPRIRDESTYVPYIITIDIPDVYCERCSLHLANPMTDKIGSDGAPGGQGCTDPNGSCFSVYYSCTTPLKITGSIPRNQFSCPSPLPQDWPLKWVGDSGAPVDASTPGVYRREAALWTDGLLQHEGVPDRYRADVGLCGSPTAPPTEAPTRLPTQTNMTNGIWTAESMNVTNSTMESTDQWDMEEFGGMDINGTVWAQFEQNNSAGPEGSNVFSALLISTSMILIFSS